MPIKPIDLQVNFSQVTTVSHDVAAIKASAEHVVQTQSDDERKKSLASGKKVKKTEKAADGLPQTDDVVRHKGHFSSNTELKDKSEESSEEHKEPETLKDPNLGNIIDLKG